MRNSLFIILYLKYLHEDVPHQSRRIYCFENNFIYYYILHTCTVYLANRRICEYTANIAPWVKLLKSYVTP